MIECSPTVTREVWERVAASDPEVLVSQTPAWMDAVCMSGRWIDVTRQYEVDGRRIVVPLARRAPTIGGLTIDASPPTGWGFGGLIAEGGVHAEDIAVVVADLARRPGLRLLIRPNPLQRDRWLKVAGTPIARCAHVLDLRPGTDAIWASMRARRQVRKAQRCVDIETDATGRLLTVFFDLLHLSRERWAQQQHEPRWLAQWRGRRLDPLVKWRRIATALGDRCRVSIAWAQGRPAAGLIVLQGRNAHYTRGAMDYELAAPTYASTGLQWKAICDAVDAGCSWYHMGETGASQSLSRFKESFGAHPHDYVEYRFERLPFTRVDHAARGAVKRLVGFREQG
jgi:Acetyltransferase (GNAT) domain